MSLSKYRQKRDKAITPEPFGGKSSDKNILRFTVQKHAATRLHYDFRLEMEGVLKSWAIPKGPTTDPDVKRLAMMVEDHPYDYRNFEGIIPEGEYGGGTVIVWDEGTYEDADLKGKPKKEQERHLLDSLNHGKLKVILNGKKLKGRFALIKSHDRGENGWLFMKMKDDDASREDVTLLEKSVQSGKTIEEVRDTSTNIYGGNKEKTDVRNKLKNPGVKSAGLKEPAKSHNPGNPEPDPELQRILETAPVSKMPSSIKPMLATLVDAPFDDEDWSFEVKWDGYRTIAYISDGEVKLESRNNKPFTDKYYPIAEALEKWKMNAVLDGEIIVLNSSGVSDFGSMQNWRSEADGEIVLYVFDILWYEGRNLMKLPLKDRYSVLKGIFPGISERIRMNEVFYGQGKEFFRAAENLGLEGMIAKRSDSSYIPDSRSKSWLKIKVQKRQEVVIGGYTLNEGTGKLFSSLLLGVYEEDRLQYVGKVGTGFNDKMQREMMKLFKPLVIKSSPFTFEPDVNEPSRFRPNPPRATAVWLKPELVCEVNYAEITSDGIFRHPSFKGMRSDKKPGDVVRETEKKTSAVVKEAEKEEKADGTGKPGRDLLKAPEKLSRKTLLNPNEETQVKTINNHDLKFTNLSKVYWPVEGITKRDMLNYYYQVAEYIVPYLKDRPQSLNRFPNGINGKSFYQKNVKGKSPDWVRTFPYTTSDGENKEFLVGSDEATLLWMANLGCIEMNPWFSRIQAEDNPDFCIIDLDPDKNSFEQVIQAAREVKKVLDELGVPSYPKTSGSTGIHIYIPLEARYSYDQSQMFAKIVVTIVHHRIPEFTSIERMIKNRKGNMYLDHLQNRPGATVAGPYSIRPKPGATVSTPLHWDEVKKGMKMDDFTIRNIPARLAAVGDLFKPVLEKGIDMEKVLELTESLA